MTRILPPALYRSLPRCHLPLLLVTLLWLPTVSVGGQCNDRPEPPWADSGPCTAQLSESPEANLRHAGTYLWFGLIERNDRRAFACGLEHLDAAQAGLDALDQGDPRRTGLVPAIAELRDKLEMQSSQSADTLYGLFPLTRLLMPTLFLEWESTRTYDLIDCADDVAVRMGIETLAERVLEHWAFKPQVPVRVVSQQGNHDLENEVIAVLSRWPRMFLRLGNEDDSRQIADVTAGVAGGAPAVASPGESATSTVESLPPMVLTVQEHDVIDGMYRYLLTGSLYQAGVEPDGPSQGRLVEQVQAWGLARSLHGQLLPVIIAHAVLLTLAVLLAPLVLWWRRKPGLPPCRDWVLLPLAAFVVGRALPWMVVPALLAAQPEPEAVWVVSGWWPPLAALALLALPVVAYWLLATRVPQRFARLRMEGRGGVAGMAAALGGVAYLSVPALLYLRSEALPSLALLTVGAVIGGWWLGRIFDHVSGEYSFGQLAIVLPLIAVVGATFIATQTLLLGLAVALLALSLGATVLLHARGSEVMDFQSLAGGPVPTGIEALVAASRQPPFQPTDGLRQAFERLQALVQGKPVAVLLCAPEGGGKTLALDALATCAGLSGDALLTELARLGRDGSAERQLFATLRVLRGACLSGGEQQAFGVLVASLSPLMGDAAAALKQQQGGTSEYAFGGAMSLVMPRFAEKLLALAEPQPSHLEDLYREVERQLRQCAAKAPLLILIDNAQDLDHASADLLAHLWQSLVAAPAPVALVLATTDPVAMRVGLPDSAVVSLGEPLLAVACDAVFEGHLKLDRKIVDWLREQTRQSSGSASDQLHLGLERVRELCRAGALRRHGGRWGLAPGRQIDGFAGTATLDEVYARRLERVAGHQELLAWCAALGMEFRVALVAEALDLPAHEVVSRLDQIAAAGGLIHDCTDQPGIYGFDGRGVWRLVRQRYGISDAGPRDNSVPERARACHARLAEVLERRRDAFGVDIFSIARQHYAAGGSAAGLAAARACCLDAAYEALRRFDAGDTEQFAAYARDCVEPQGMPRAADEALRRLDLMRATRFESQQVQQVLVRQVCDYIDNNRDSAELETLAAVAQAAYHAHLSQSAVDVATLLLDRLDADSPPQLVVQAHQFIALGTPEERHFTVYRHLLQALKLLDRVPAPLPPRLRALRARLLDSLGNRLTWRAEALIDAQPRQAASLLDRAGKLLRESLAIKRSPAIDDIDGQARTLGNLGRLAMAHRPPWLDQASDWFGQDLALAQHLRDRRSQAQCLSHLGEIALLQDDIKRAETHYSDSMDLATDTTGRCFALLGLLEVAGRRRDQWPRQWQERVTQMQCLMDDDCDGRLPTHCLEQLRRKGVGNADLAGLYQQFTGE